MNTEFKYELLEEDFVQSNLDYVKISKNFEKQMRMIKYGFVIVVAFMIIIFMRSIQGVIFGVLLAAVYSFGFDKYYKFSVKKRVHKSIEKGQLKLYENGMTAVVSDAGVVIKGKKEKTKYSWNDILMVVESPSYVYLLSKTGTAEVLPKRNQDEALMKKEIIERAVEIGKIEYKTIS
ncbi:MAG: YcxB family protein [Proteocatella sp.]